PAAPSVPQALPPHPEAGQAVLATWRLLLDRGRLQDGEPFLAGTAKPAVVRLSPATAAEIGATGAVTVRAGRGEVTLPLELTADLPDRVVWLPTNSAGLSLYRDLGAAAGDVVAIAAGVLADAAETTAGGVR
ncbi:molybdopterin dinucleotide binding domain-containing protein, partial [Actinomadura fibrosa]